jgi:hypothetical protein
MLTHALAPAPEPFFFLAQQADLMLVQRASLRWKETTTAAKF